MRIDLAMNAYEALVETAEKTRKFSIASIWQDNGKGLPEYNLARRVVHDLWFHRMIEPHLVSTNGVVREWRWRGNQ